MAVSLDVVESISDEYNFRFLNYYLSFFAIVMYTILSVGPRWSVAIPFSTEN